MCCMVSSIYAVEERYNKNRAVGGAFTGCLPVRLVQCVCLCVCENVCMCVCLCECVCACMSRCVNVCMSVCVCVSVCVFSSW